MVTDTTLEIDALRQELEPFGISFFDLPKASPKFGRTKAACREVIHWLVSRPDLVRSIREKKCLPVRQITDALHTGGKILERNRTYIIAGVLICTAAFGHHLYFTPTSYVYLDINPSIRLDLNRFERIIDVVPLNDDAENLLSSATISRRNARECMNDIVAACQEQNYLNEQNTDIEVSVRTDDAKLESAVETASAAIGETELAVSVFQMDEEENNSAMGYHISARRLRAVRAYTEQFGGTLDENLEALKGVTSDEIYEIIREYRRTVQAAEKPGAQPQTENSAPPETSLSPDTPQPKPQNPSDRREEPQAQHPDSPASNSQPAPGHQLTAKRLDAIRAYAEQFGGTLEENAALLQGIRSLNPLCLLYVVIFFPLYALFAGGKLGFRRMLKYIITPAVTAFATQSSAATLPVSKEACDNIGVPKDVSDLVLPMGCTMHMDGSVLSSIVKITFLFGVFHMPFTGVGTYAMAIAVAILSAFVLSGAPGGGLVGEMLIVSMFGFPAEAFPLIATLGFLFDPPATCLNAPGAIGPHSQGYEANVLVITSGQIHVNPADGTVPEGISAQAEQSCKNVGAILEAAGTGFEKVIKTTCFLADMGDFAAFNEVYARYFISKPARSCVAVKDLPKGVLCEIEAIAVK